MNHAAMKKPPTQGISPEPLVELVHDVGDRREGDRKSCVGDAPFFGCAEGRHRCERAEERKREVVAGRIRDRREQRECSERRGRRPEREAVPQEEQRTADEGHGDDGLVVVDLRDRELDDRPDRQPGDQQVREVPPAPLDVAIHEHKVLRPAASRIGRTEERRILLEDEMNRARGRRCRRRNAGTMAASTMRKEPT